MKQEVNGLLQAVTFWAHSAPLSAKGGESFWSLAEKRKPSKNERFFYRLLFDVGENRILLLAFLDLSTLRI